MYKYLYVLLVCLSLPVGAQQGVFPGSGLGGPITATSPPLNDNSTRVPNTAWIQTNRAPAVTPETFGGWGDAQLISSGCNTTASSSTVVCPSASFVSGDGGIGKEIWIGGAGIGGGALGSVIATVVNSTTITISPSPASATLSNAYAVYGHDDVNAIQSCWNYSAAHRVQCFMDSPTGYLEANGNSGNGLLMAVTPVTFNGAMNVQGSSMTKGTPIYCEIDGDCISLQSGPVQGVVMSNLSIEVDQTQPNSRGFHFNATPNSGAGNSGGLFNSLLSYIQVDNPAKECMWMDGGGGPGYTFLLPNQIDTFLGFTCNGPNQSHPANLILMSGQAAQITFINGQVNGLGWTNTGATSASSLYPNWLIKIVEKTGGLGDCPTDVKFYGYTFEVGTQGLYVGEGCTNIHYDSSYIENVSTPLYAYNNGGLTFSGNHIANSGNITGVMQFAGQVTGAARDTHVYGAVLPAAFAVCSNDSNTIDFAGSDSTVMTTSDCGTAQIGTHTSTLTVAGGTTEFVNGSATTVTTINAPGIAAGKTLTLYAASSPGIVLGTGGNINFGGLTAPYTVAPGHSVTLTLFDLGPVWVITAVN